MRLIGIHLALFAMLVYLGCAIAFSVWAPDLLLYLFVYGIAGVGLILAGGCLIATLLGDQDVPVRSADQPYRSNR